ncbi:MAG TPA: hypothetical protein VGM13_15870 [Thermoanaerobaculia bacterium]|jgi:hypothetical protein
MWSEAGPKLYVLWAALAIALSISVAGLTAESVTRLLVIGFLFAQVLPFLAVRDGLSPGRTSGGRGWLVVPAVVGTYLVCGALIKAAGRWSGLEPR